MKPCSCAHVGQCPFTSGPETTYPDGSPVYRPLRPDESIEEIQLGDLVSPHSAGRAFVLARALDPERAAKHARSLNETRCRAHSWWWRVRHPAPPQP